MPLLNSTLIAFNDSSESNENIRSSLLSALQNLSSGGLLSVELSPPLSERIVAELTLTGFVNINVQTPMNITAMKPSWSSSGGVSLKSRASREVARVASSVDDISQVILMNPASSSLVDENSLLNGEDFSEGKSNGGNGCLPKRKACANCSCGRKEQEEKEERGEAVTLRETTESKEYASSCGNCSKGDAFRCAGCPFLGKPAFSEDASGSVTLVL